MRHRLIRSFLVVALFFFRYDFYLMIKWCLVTKNIIVNTTALRCVSRRHVYEGHFLVSFSQKKQIKTLTNLLSMASLLKVLRQYSWYFCFLNNFQLIPLALNSCAFSNLFNILSLVALVFTYFLISCLIAHISGWCQFES